MIEQTAADAPLWDDKKSAVEVLAFAADLLWKDSPARSAKWLTRAWELIDQVPEGEQNERLKEGAFDLLNDVEKDLRKEEPSANSARILLGRATVLARIDKQQPLFALQQALQLINKLDRFELKEPTAPRLGFSISPRSESLADAPRVGFSFRSAIEAIVQDEFEEIAELAGSFKVTEVRGVGRLEVARLFLEKTDSSR